MGFSRGGQQVSGMVAKPLMFVWLRLAGKEQEGMFKISGVWGHHFQALRGGKFKLTCWIALTCPSSTRLPLKPMRREDSMWAVWRDAWGLETQRWSNTPKSLHRHRWEQIVDSLKPSVGHVLRVHACNAVGWSDWSEAQLSALHSAPFFTLRFLLFDKLRLTVLQQMQAVTSPRDLHCLRADKLAIAAYHSNFVHYTSPLCIFRELISVIVTPPITPNNFWGFNKRNSQEKSHLLVLSLLGRSTPPITPKYSQKIYWRNKFHLCYPRKFSGN